ncbi:hypothetical protein GCM10020000_69610 [Streptomyces olivoverticillatus]
MAVALAASEAARRGRVIAGLRRRHAEREALLQYRLDQHDAETWRFAREVMPEALKLMRHGAPPPTRWCGSPSRPTSSNPASPPRTARSSGP